MYYTILMTSISDIQSTIKKSLNNLHHILSEQEESDLIETSCIFIDHYICNNILDMSFPDFHDKLMNLYLKCLKYN